MQRPLCFVLMPFGRKKDPGGGPDIDFDAIYEQGIRPAIEEAGLLPIRADEERTGGIVHKAMFERLLLCDYAVADVTTQNANVFYELGVRHAVRPATTVILFARNHKLPFDIGLIRAAPYDLAPDNTFRPDDAAALRTTLARRLDELRRDNHAGARPDSPVFQLLTDYTAPDIARLKTDTFRERAEYAAEIKEALADARARRDVDELEQVEAKLGALDAVESGVLVDLFLSYRAAQRFDKMISLYDKLPQALQRAVLMREQLGFALNRTGQRDKAIAVLTQVIAEHGISSEACGILGRIYKDQWAEARARGDAALARGHLDKAIRTYLDGFQSDWRDAYPGINAITLLDIKGDESSQKRKAELLPVVRFAVLQRLRSRNPDYWDHASLLELAVLDDDREKADEALGNALVSVREPWEPATTANNLRLIEGARRERNLDQPWLEDIIAALESRSRAMGKA